MQIYHTNVYSIPNIIAASTSFQLDFDEARAVLREKISFVNLSDQRSPFAWPLIFCRINRFQSRAYTWIYKNTSCPSKRTARTSQRNRDYKAFIAQLPTSGRSLLICIKIGEHGWRRGRRGVPRGGKGKGRGDA